jgi:hypothetical protein
MPPYLPFAIPPGMAQSGGPIFSIRPTAPILEHPGSRPRIGYRLRRLVAERVAAKVRNPPADERTAERQLRPALS